MRLLVCTLAGARRLVTVAVMSKPLPPLVGVVDVISKTPSKVSLMVLISTVVPPGLRTTAMDGCGITEAALTAGSRDSMNDGIEVMFVGILEAVGPPKTAICPAFRFVFQICTLL